MKSKNNFICALLPLHWVIKIEVWRGVSHPPLFSVWSRLKQHLSDDNLEEILPLSFDTLLCRDREDANYTETFFFSPTCTTLSAPLNLSSFLVCLRLKTVSRRGNGELQLIGPFAKDGQKLWVGLMSGKQKKREGMNGHFCLQFLDFLGSWIFKCTHKSVRASK